MHTDLPDGYWQSFVVWPLAWSLVWLDDILTHVHVPFHWGFAIILFTIVIKIITLPLTLTQIRGMQAQKELQPRLQELQQKYGKDREKMSQAQMELYREAGVNPLSGCLPLLIQMPILMGLYSALVVLRGDLHASSFLWIPDLGFPEYRQGLSWISAAFNRGDYGTLLAYTILPALLVASQFSMQKWMTPTTPSQSGENDQPNMMKQIGPMMTLMFGFFTLQAPAGLSLYWVTSNLLQIGQQLLFTSDRFKPVANMSAQATATDSPSDPASAGVAGNDLADHNGTSQKDSTQAKRANEENKPNKVSRAKRNTRRRKKKRK